MLVILKLERQKMKEWTVEKITIFSGPNTVPAQQVNIDYLEC